MTIEENLKQWIKFIPKDKFDKDLHKFSYNDMIEFTDQYIISQSRNIKDSIEKLMNVYVTLFCDKHDYCFDGWVGGEVGGITSCSDYFIDLRDMRLDIDNDVPKEMFVKWYEESMHSHLKDGYSINYKTYLKLN